MSRNDEYWELTSTNQRQFWESIANEINESFGTEFTMYQVKQKWKNLLRDHVVSCILC
jgi:hypothetical protein